RRVGAGRGPSAVRHAADRDGRFRAARPARAGRPFRAACNMSALLEVDGVTMRFGGLTAVDAASLAVAGGAITGLIGPNGAGKTTVVAVVSGFLAAAAGQVRYEGEDITGVPVHVRAARGIARTFQVVQPFAGLSVRENIAVGAYLRHAAREAALAA